MAFFLRVLTFPPLNQIVAVPQIVVNVTLVRASPTPGSGRGTSRMPILPLPRNTAARIVVAMDDPPFVA